MVACAAIAVLGVPEILDSAKALSGLADKVAGFAISSNLWLIFACLKDLGDWVW